jgi:hypothetical protein
MYIATLDESWKFLIDILLERIVSRYFNRKIENMGKIGEETQQLLLVFGRYEVRNQYLQERYSIRKINDNTKLGKKFFGKLFFRFFDARPVKLPVRKRGYNDHGTLKAPHEYHGEKEVEGEMINEDKKDVQEILLEIYKKSTENYLIWLKKNLKNLDENKPVEIDNNKPTEKEISNEKTIRTKN